MSRLGLRGISLYIVYTEGVLTVSFLSKIKDTTASSGLRRDTDLLGERYFSTEAKTALYYQL